MASRQVSHYPHDPGKHQLVLNWLPVKHRLHASLHHAAQQSIGVELGMAGCSSSYATMFVPEMCLVIC